MPFFVLYTRTLFIPSKCNDLCLPTPNSLSIPLPPSFPLGNPKWSFFYVCESVSVLYVDSFVSVLFYCLFLTVLGLCGSAGFSLVVESRGHSLAVVLGLLM